MEGLSLRQNFSWTMLGNVTYAACQWGMLISLAKIGTPEMVGQFALGLAITAPIILFSNLQLRGVQATDACREYRFGNYLALRLATTFLAAVIIVAVAAAGGYPRDVRLTIVFVGLAKCFEALSDVFYGLFQQAERMDCISLSMIIKGCLSLAVFIIAVFLTHRVWAGAAALSATWALVLALYDVPNGANLLNTKPRWAGVLPVWDRPTLVKLARLSFPLGLTMMLISLNTNIPRYFIQHYWGERELGFFAAAAYLIVAGTTVVSALGQSASPRLANHYAARENALFKTLLAKLIGVGAALGLSGIVLSLVAGRLILALLYSKEYAEMAGVFSWIMAAAAIAYVASLLGYALTATRRFAIQPFLFAVVAFLNGLMCLALVPRHGPTGAAWAIGLANIVQLVAFSLCIRYALRASRSAVVMVHGDKVYKTNGS